MVHASAACYTSSPFLGLCDLLLHELTASLYENLESMSTNQRI